MFACVLIKQPVLISLFVQCFELLLLLFLNKVSLYSPGYPEMHYAELSEIHLSLTAGIKEMHHHSWPSFEYINAGGNTHHSSFSLL